jgi:hypothetical protein
MNGFSELSKQFQEINALRLTLITGKTSESGNSIADV